MKFLPYNPEQAYLLPPSVREVLGEDHICFFVHQVVERLELSALEQGYVEEGRPAYHPVLLLKVWLYAYVLGLTSARRLEQRGAGRLGLPVPGGWGHTGFLDPQPVPHTACPGAERSVHAGGGVGAFARYGSAGARRRRLDAGGGQCLVRARGDDEKVAVPSGLRFGGRFAAGRSSAIRRIPRKRRGSRSHRRRWQRSSSGWRRFRGGWNSCAKWAETRFRSPMPTADFCGTAKDSRWATQQRRRSAKII